MLKALQKIEDKLVSSGEIDTKQIVAAVDTIGDRITQGIKAIPKHEATVVKTQQVHFPDQIKAVVDQKLKVDFEDLRTKLKINQVRPVVFPEVQKVLNVNEIPRQVEVNRDPLTDRVAQVRYIYENFDITYTYSRNRMGSITGYVVRKNARQ